MGKTINRAKEAIDLVASEDMSLEDYISALEDIIDHAQVALDAAREDLRSKGGG